MRRARRSRELHTALRYVIEDLGGLAVGGLRADLSDLLVATYKALPSIELFLTVVALHRLGVLRTNTTKINALATMKYSRS